MTDHNSEEEWDSEAEPTPTVTCILGKYSQEFPTVGEYWQHVKENDNLDMFMIFQKFSYHGYIRIINYLRRSSASLNKKFPTTQSLLQTYDSEIVLNNDYLSKPVLEADPFIIFASDLDQEEQDDEMPGLTSEPAQSTSKSEWPTPSGDKAKREAVLQKLLAATLEDDNKKQEKKLKKHRKKPENKNFKSERDNDYFEGYGDLSIHVEMLGDFVRTDTYRRGIMAHDIKDKIVLDIGAGTGILSIFAAQAGAKHVYAIEPAAVASDAQEIINDNGFTNKITIVRKTSEELTLADLGGNTPDFIVSEWMGYFLYFEGMLPSVIKARQKFGDTARMLPSSCTLRISLLTTNKYREDRYEKWADKNKNPWGLTFKPLARYQSQTTEVEVFDENELTGSTEIHYLDLDKAGPDDVDFESKFTFDLKHLAHTKPLEIYGVVGHFSTDFGPTVTLNTSPGSTPTHWKQAVFMFKKPLIHDCKAEPTLPGRLDCKRLANGRDLEVIIQFPDKDNYTERFCLD